MRFIALCLACLVAACPALAQDGWSFRQDETGTVRAATCPVNDDETGNSLCLSLGCRQGQPLGWRVTMAGGDLPDPLDVEILVDGARAGALTLTQVPSEVPFDFVASVDPDRDADLIQTLRAGRAATLRLGDGEGQVERPMSLSGSANAIASVQAQCPTRPALVTDPEAEVAARLEAECAEINGELEMLDGFARRADLDADGREDMVLEYGAALCSTALSLYCGSGGCATDIYLARDGGYLRAWSDVMRGVVDDPGTPRVALSMHGSACDSVGADACVLRVDLSGNVPRVVERVSGPDATALLDDLYEQAKTP